MAALCPPFDVIDSKMGRLIASFYEVTNNELRQLDRLAAECRLDAIAMLSAERPISEDGDVTYSPEQNAGDASVELFFDQEGVAG